MIYEQFYILLKISILVCYILLYFNRSSIPDKYLATLEFYLKMFVAIVLIITFNPFVSYTNGKFSFSSFSEIIRRPFMKAVGFDGGIFLLLSLIIALRQCTPATTPTTTN